MTEPTDRVLDRARLLQLLDAYGADPARWPEPERAAAQALLARDPEAQRLQREAAELDTMLDSDVALEPSASLRRAVAEIPLRAAPASVALPALPWLLASIRRSVFAAAAVLALGVLAGVATATEDPVVASAETAVPAVENGDEQDGLDTLVELAFNEVLDEEQVP